MGFCVCLNSGLNSAFLGSDFASSAAAAGIEFFQRSSIDLGCRKTAEALVLELVRLVLVCMAYEWAFCHLGMMQYLADLIMHLSFKKLLVLRCLLCWMPLAWVNWSSRRFELTALGMDPHYPWQIHCLSSKLLPTRQIMALSCALTVLLFRTGAAAYPEGCFYLLKQLSNQLDSSWRHLLATAHPCWGSCFAWISSVEVFQAWRRSSRGSDCCYGQPSK